MAPVAVDEKGPSVPTEQTLGDENNEITTTANGNVMDNGLQRGLKNRHLVCGHCE